MVEFDVIEAMGLDKRFGAVHAVRGVSFTLEKGSAVGLLGPNGAGKTTTLRMIAGFLPPDAGAVRIDGLDTLTQSLKARQRIGYLPESAPLYPELTVTGLLGHRARLYGMDRRRRRVAVERVIERCWLTEMRRRRVGTLSKGYRQRVGLAAAILHDPPALLLDEPTNGLDPSQITEMRALVRELAHDRALLVSSHILGEVEKTCARVIVLARGRVRADADLGELARAAGAGARCVAEVKVGDAGDDFSAALRAMPGVAALDSAPIPEDDGWRRFVLTMPRDPGPIAQRVSALAAQRGAALRELHTEAPTLERIFLDLVAGSEPGAPDR